MNKIKQAELTIALNAYQDTEHHSDEVWLLMVLEYAKYLSRKLYIKSVTEETKT